jgi:hypothetical protein
MSEDDIRTKVVYPWLVGCGFNPAELSIEFSFDIKLGRAVYRVDSQTKTTRSHSRAEPEVVARPRADMLVRRGQMNLMIVEVKAPDEAVDDAARDQGISYARLLPQIAPFVVVTNGVRTAVYDSITREELSGGSIPPDHPGLRAGYRISADELQLRAEALETFVSLSPDNLLLFCEKQLEFRMRRLRDNDPASGKKYIPGLYVDRPRPRECIEILLDDRQLRAVAVIGRPQVGKTNFLCRFAEERVRSGCPVLFYPAISLNTSLLQETAEDFCWLLGDQNSVAVLTSKLGNILRRTGSRLTLIIDGWNEADVDTARTIDREWERVCSGDANIQLVVSFTHSAAKRLLVHAGNPSYLAEAAGIGLHGFEIIESDPAAAGRKAGWSAVVVEPYSHAEQKEAYRILGQHFQVTVPDSHCPTADPYLLGVAMRHFAGRTLPDSMDEPELLRAWLEARIARSLTDSFDIRAALTELGRTMITGGSPLPERLAKQCWGLPSVAPVPPALSELALLACLVGGSERFIDFYNSRDRDYVIACWSFRWPERLEAREVLWGEFTNVVRTRPGTDALAWFFGQPAHLAPLLEEGGALPSVSDAGLRRLFLSSVGQLIHRGNHELNDHYERWSAQCQEWAAADPDLRCRVEAVKLMAGITEEKDDLLAVIPSNESQRAFIHGLLEVVEEYSPGSGGLGQLVLDAFQRLHWDEASGHEEEDSSLTLILREECSHPSRGIRAAARACLGHLIPRLYLADMAQKVEGCVVPDEYLEGVNNAVSSITEMYYGSGYCPSYLDHLGYGERTMVEKFDERVPGHYREEQQALETLSRYENVSRARAEMHDLVETLRSMMPPYLLGQEEGNESEPRRDAPGQLYLFDEH